MGHKSIPKLFIISHFPSSVFIRGVLHQVLAKFLWFRDARLCGKRVIQTQDTITLVIVTEYYINWRVSELPFETRKGKILIAQN